MTVYAFSDPYSGQYKGEYRIKHVPFASGTVFPRQSGKFVSYNSTSGYYEKTTASSSDVAGVMVLDAVGISGGHPETVSAGTLLPVNFAIDVFCVIPTTGRSATASDIGKSFGVAIGADGTQYINLNASGASALLVVDSVVDIEGNYVVAKIKDNKRGGAL